MIIPALKEKPYKTEKLLTEAFKHNKLGGKLTADYLWSHLSVHDREVIKARALQAQEKWKNILKKFNNINLHFIGKLQSNKAKQAFQIFNYVHSLDNEKLAKIFNELEVINKRKIKYFVQVNIGSEPQKNGIDISAVNDFVNYCKNKLNLNVRGLMAIPPKDQNPEFFFKQLYELNLANNLEELSMGMSDDYKIAAKYNTTYVRIGSAIFS